MAVCGVTIFSENLSGLTTNVTFYPCSGGTISLGDQVFPFNYVDDYSFDDYSYYDFHCNDNDLLLLDLLCY